MHIGLLQILNEPNLQLPQWDYIGTPADMVKKGMTRLFSNEWIYMPDLTKTSKNEATVLLGLFEFHNLDIKNTFVYKIKDAWLSDYSNGQIKELPPFTISLHDYNKHDLEYLYQKKLITLKPLKKKWFETNDYNNFILKNGKKIFIKDNIMLQEGISFLLGTSNGFIVKNTSEIIWWLNFINKGQKNKKNSNTTIKDFSDLILKHPAFIIVDNYYKSLL